jgi:hypothetical protein
LRRRFFGDELVKKFIPSVPLIAVFVAFAVLAIAPVVIAASHPVASHPVSPALPQNSQTTLAQAQTSLLRSMFLQCKQTYSDNVEALFCAHELVERWKRKELYDRVDGKHY